MKTWIFFHLSVFLEVKFEIFAHGPRKVKFEYFIDGGERAKSCLLSAK